MDEHESQKRKDPVARLIFNSTPAEFVKWLVESKDLPADEANNTESNLREAFKFHRLQGRLDRAPWLATLALLLGLRQHVKALERPPRGWDKGLFPPEDDEDSQP